MFFSFFFFSSFSYFAAIARLVLVRITRYASKRGKENISFLSPLIFFFPLSLSHLSFRTGLFFLFVCLLLRIFFFPLFRLFEGTIVFPFFFLPLIPFSFFAYAYQHPQSMTPSQQLFRCFYGLLEKKKKKRNAAHELLINGFLESPNGLNTTFTLFS